MDEFQRGLIYSVHPRMLAPLEAGRRHRIIASSRRRIGLDESVLSYEPLYRRARSLLSTRIAELRVEGGASTHAWIQAHGWFRMPTPRFAIIGAAVTMEVMADNVGDRPAGEAEPSAEALSAPFVAQLTPPGGVAGDAWDEFFNDFDFREPGADSSAVNVSYGEYVDACEGLDFEPFVRRAEHRARVYCQAGRIVDRKWQCLETGKTTTPTMAHVDLILDVGPT